MNKEKIYFLLFSAISTLVYSVSGIAHPDGNDWHNHMPGMWGWGWPMMIIFWVVIILLIVLLAVSIVNILKK